MIILSAGVALALQPSERSPTGNQVLPRPQSLSSQSNKTEKLNPLNLSRPKIENTMGATNESNNSSDNDDDDDDGDSTMPIQSPAELQLSTRVHRELKQKFPEYDSSEYDIYSQNGVVTLLGPVSTKSDAINMARAVKKVKGVRSVRNNFSIEEPRTR